MTKHTQIKNALTLALSLIFSVVGCNPALPNELPETNLPNDSTNFDTIQSKPQTINTSITRITPRKVYFPKQAQDAYILHLAQERMRKPSPGLSRQFYITPGEEQMAFSIGDTRDGYLINGQTLPAPSLLLRQLPVQYERGIVYGTPNLIKILVDTARTMEKKYPGTIMYLGNLGLKEGGDIPYSVSHNAGRDADIAFYLTDSNGNQVHPNNMYKVGARMIAHSPEGELTFDVDKNTSLIETLLTHPKIHIQFIFAAKHISSAVQKELVRRGASEELLARFENSVQNQAAHNDHFHIRIYCSPEDICAGCMDKSTIHEYQDDPVPIREKCVSKHLKTLSSSKSDEDQKASAIQRLALIGVAGEHKAQILKHIQDQSPKVRIATAIAAKNLDNTAAQALIQQLKNESDNEVRLAIIDALATYDSQNTKIAFNAELTKTDLPDEQLRIILKYMTHHPNEIHLEPLISRLELFPDDEDVLLAISTIANRNFCSNPNIQKQTKPADKPESRSPAQLDSEKQSEPKVQTETSNPVNNDENASLIAKNDKESDDSGLDSQILSTESDDSGLDSQMMSTESDETSLMTMETPVETDNTVMESTTEIVQPKEDAEKSQEIASNAPDIIIPENPCLEEIRHWAAKNKHKSRNQWLLDGFKAAGFPVFAIDIPDVPFILDAIDGPRPISINAQIALKKLSKQTQDSLDWSVADARWHYTRYFKRHAKKLRLDLSDRDEKGIKKSK